MKEEQLSQEDCDVAAGGVRRVGGGALAGSRGSKLFGSGQEVLAEILGDSHKQPG